MTAEADGQRSDSLARAVKEVEALLERTAHNYPADLPAHHLARRTDWHLELHWTESGFGRCTAAEFEHFDALRRCLETTRCHAEALLVSERRNEVILTAADRESLTERALGILPSSESARFHELLACPELRPRRIARSGQDLVSAVERVSQELGSATALTFGMLVLAGLRHEEELLRYAARIDKLFERIVSNPTLIQALEQPEPEEPQARFDVGLGILMTVRDILWQTLPGRVAQEFLLTQVIDAYVGERSGGGDSLGLAIIDSIILGKLGFPVYFMIEDGVLSLEVAVGPRKVYWDLTQPLPISSVPTVPGRTLGLTELFAVAYGSLAAFCFSRNMWDKAIDAYQRELELVPSSAETQTSLAVCFMRKQMPSEALKTLKAALELAPDSPPVYHQLGNAYAMMSNWSRAVEAYKKALRLQPDYVEVYNNLGFAYMRMENPAQAIAAFETAIEKRPDYFQAHFNLGNIHLEQGDFDKAVKYYRDTVRLDARFVAAYYNLGRAYYEKHDLDEAIHCYQKAVQLNPKHFGAWHNLGIAFRDKGQTEKAVEALERAVTINPNLMR
jgi:tetratricopeptide (TPR) repeat protein